MPGAWAGERRERGDARVCTRECLRGVGAHERHQEDDVDAGGEDGVGVLDLVGGVLEELEVDGDEGRRDEGAGDVERDHDLEEVRVGVDLCVRF